MSDEIEVEKPKLVSLEKARATRAEIEEEERAAAIMDESPAAAGMLAGLRQGMQESKREARPAQIACFLQAATHVNALLFTDENYKLRDRLVMQAERLLSEIEHEQEIEDNG